MLSLAAVEKTQQTVSPNGSLMFIVSSKDITVWVICIFSMKMEITYSISYADESSWFVCYHFAFERHFLDGKPN